MTASLSGDASSLKPCPFCGEHPYDLGLVVECWGPAGKSHGQVRAPKSTWNRRTVTVPVDVLGVLREAREKLWALHRMETYDVFSPENCRICGLLARIDAILETPDSTREASRDCIP